MKNSTRTILAVLAMLLIIGTAPDTYSRGGPANEKCKTIFGEVIEMHVRLEPRPEDQCFIKIDDESTIYIIYGIRYAYLKSNGIELELEDEVEVVARQKRGYFLACEITKGGVTVVVRDCCETIE